MPDIAMCTQVCVKSPNCYRHPKSGTLPSEWRQAYMVNNPTDCMEYMPRSNEEMTMDNALYTFLKSIDERRAAPTGRKGDWDVAYNETSTLLAGQLEQIADIEGPDHELVVALKEVADFYRQPVEDPEMGTFDMGAKAAMRDFGVAVIAVMQERRPDERWDALLDRFTAE